VSVSEEGFSGNQKTSAVLRRRSFFCLGLARVIILLTLAGLRCGTPPLLP